MLETTNISCGQIKSPLDTEKRRDGMIMSPTILVRSVSYGRSETKKDIKIRDEYKKQLGKDIMRIS